MEYQVIAYFGRSRLSHGRSPPAVTGSVVRSNHSMGFPSSGGAISRANTTVTGGAVCVVLVERWADRAIWTTGDRRAHVAWRSR